VRGLVEAHDGRVAVGQAASGGAEFQFTLPAGAPEGVS
jgi:signal transduction histidine kinase